MSKVSSPLPADLSRAIQRFAEWRKHRSGHKIPGELWGTAADLASRYGISRTARLLRVQYYDLKKRVLALPVPAALPSVASSSAGFVEILNAVPADACDVVVELEHTSGSKMRICLKGAGASVLSELSRTFLESRP